MPMNDRASRRRAERRSQGNPSLNRGQLRTQNAAVTQALDAARDHALAVERATLTADRETLTRDQAAFEAAQKDAQGRE